MKKAETRARTAARVVRARRSSRDWPRLYGRGLVVTDALVILLTLAIFRAAVVPPEPIVLTWPDPDDSWGWFPLVIVGALWLAFLTMAESRERHIVGNGSTEYRRVVNGSVFMLAVLIAIAFFFRLEVQRTLFLIAIPIGIGLLVLSRWAMRQWLRRQQAADKYVYRTVVMAEPENAAHVIESIRRTHGTGFDVVGVVTSGRPSESIRGVPVIGGFGNVIEAFDIADADTLIIAGRSLACEKTPIVRESGPPLHCHAGVIGERHARRRINGSWCAIRHEISVNGQNLLNGLSILARYRHNSRPLFSGGWRAPVGRPLLRTAQ